MGESAVEISRSSAVDSSLCINASNKMEVELERVAELPPELREKIYLFLLVKPLELERVTGLPPELKKKIFSFLPADIQHFCVHGYILIDQNEEFLLPTVVLVMGRSVCLPSGTVVQVFAMGGGAGDVVRLATMCCF